MRVVALGDNVIDVYRNQNVRYPGGNALNVAVNAARLGHETSYLGAFADDAYALFLRGFLEQEGVGVEACPVRPKTTTKLCIEDVVDGERSFVRVEDDGWVGPVALDDAALAVLGDAHLILTSVNAKLGDGLDALGDMDGLVAFDLGEKAKYRTPDWLAVVARVADVVQLSWGESSEEELETVVGMLSQEALVAVTRGSDPTLFAWPDGRMEMAIEAIVPRDTMGAGDAHLTALACGLAELGWRKGGVLDGRDLGDVARFAAAWAARACSVDGGFETPYQGPLAVVFDMDGVLVASEDVWEELFRGLLAEHGLALDEDTRRDLYGCSDEHENKVLSTIMGCSVEEAAKLKDAYVREHPIDYGSIGIEGVRELLGRLRELGMKLGIATSSPERDVRRMLAECGLEGSFDCVVNAQDVERTKPDPALYLCAAKRLGVDSAYCVAVDDSPYGVEAAFRAGMYPIHFAQTERTPEADAHARLVCGSHEEVCCAIEALAALGKM